MDKSANTWFFKKASASFGSMADLGIHKIDLMRYLIGSEITSVYSSMKVLDQKVPRRYAYRGGRQLRGGAHFRQRRAGHGHYQLDALRRGVQRHYAVLMKGQS